MVMKWDNPAHKSWTKDAVLKACSELGLKVARHNRTWAVRQEHRELRSQKEAHPLPIGEKPANPYANLTQEEVHPDGVPTGSASAPRPKTGRINPEFAKRLRKMTKLKVGSLNIQGLTHKVAELECFLSKEKVDVCAVQETKLKAGREIQVKGFRVFYQDVKFQNKEGDGGVVTLVAEHLAAAVSKEPCTVPNQLWIRLAGTDSRNDLLICSAYMPGEGENKETREKAFEALSEAVCKHQAQSSDVVLLGDLNAKLGRSRDDDDRLKKLIGQHTGPAARTSNGALLTGVISKAGLVNLGGQRAPPVGPFADFWFTRKDPVTGALHAIDYALVSERLSERASFWVDYKQVTGMSDHQFIGTLIPCPRKIVRRRGRRRARRRFQLEKMIQRSSKEADVEAAKNAKGKYQECLAKAFEGYDPTHPPAACPRNCGIADCACAGVADFIERTEKALEESVGSKISGGRFTRGWFDDEVKNAIKKRREAHARYLQCDSSENWKEFCRLRKLAKRMVMVKKRADWAKFMQRIEDAYKNNHKQLWQLIDRLMPSGKKLAVAPVRGKNGALARSEEQIMDVWAEHQESLGTPVVHELQDTDFARRVRTQVEHCEKITWSIPDGHLDREFEDAEIEEAIDELGYHKAPNEDGTRNPMYKCGGEEMRKHLRKLFNHLRSKEIAPDAWQRSAVVNLFKDGDREDPGNYRGIALMSCLGKLYFSLWARRMAKHAETVLSENAGGFRTRRSTVDQVLTLHEVLLRRQRAGQNTYCCFVDFSKAFDTVWHDGLWKRLWDSGVKGKAWRIVRNLYSSMHAQVKVGHRVTRSVRMRQGVRQGCPLSPILFNYFIDELSNCLRKSGYGVDADGVHLHSLLYADDVVLMASNADDLQKLIDVVDKFCRRWHMNINLNKSEVMVVGEHEGGSPWHCWGKSLKVVKFYKYLGVWITHDLKWDKHFEVTLKKANTRTESLAKLFNNSRVPARAKVLVWLAYVRPVLEYGGEVWHANAVQAKALESVQTRAGVRIFKLNQHTNSLAVRALMGVPSLHLRRWRSRLKYLIKLWTMQGTDRLVRQVVETPPGRATKGQSKKLHWKTRVTKKVKELMKDDVALAAAYERVRESKKRNMGVLPLGLDHYVPGYMYYPVDKWTTAVTEWVGRANLKDINNAGKRRTLSTLLRACKGVEALPRFPLTRHPNSGPDQIRTRLLAGTNSLNSTLSKWNPSRGPQCPHPDCKEKESADHFLLDCEAYAGLRAEYTKQLGTLCDCKTQHGPSERTCLQFYESLDREGKVLFMLGGPVDGRTPEPATDRESRNFVLHAHEARKARLEELYAAPPVDLTVVPNGSSNESGSNNNRCDHQNAGSARNDIRDFFRPHSHAHAPPAHPPSSPEEGGEQTNVVHKHSGYEPEGRYHTLLHTHAYPSVHTCSPQIGTDPVGSNEGSGPNGKPSMGST